MYYIFETVFKEKGVLEVSFDEIPISPRDDTNLTRMLCFHKRYRLCDADLPDRLGISRDDFNSWDDLYEWIWKNQDPIFVWPVSIYDHGGVSIHLGEPRDPWDSSRVGYLYVRKKDARRYFGVARVTKKIRKKAREVAQAEFNQYKKYFEGDVFCMRLRIIGKEPEDSVCGITMDNEEDLKDLVRTLWGYRIKELKELERNDEKWSVFLSVTDLNQWVSDNVNQILENSEEMAQT